LFETNQIREVFGDNHDMISKLTIIEGEGEHKMVRMANLAIVGSHKVNWI
jgi:glucan phosphorylase